ncbi:hypothetical protein DFH07DRAFT_936384 [Mycena maculata]|uniref:Uncharacterized protein n=1 Tax=Mycena maculata TaxID=230809 RepID=A0AAD7NX74_9AGAR|nr:hypothetical protein DFH07DRAFT_936384 [Mycena maculata]
MSVGLKVNRVDVSLHVSTPATTLMANPPSTLLLTHRGVEAWLTDHSSHTISHGSVKVDGNQISTTCTVSEKTAYRVRWRSTPNSPITALCNIFLPSPRQNPVAANFMDATKADTQYRISNTCMSQSDSHKDGWFHSAKGGFVQLEVRRGKGAPERVSTSHSMEKINIDLIDKDDGPPFVVFRFEFVSKRAHSPEANPGPQKRQKVVAVGNKAEGSNKPRESQPPKTPSKPEKSPNKSVKTPHTPASGGPGKSVQSKTLTTPNKPAKPSHKPSHKPSTGGSGSRGQQSTIMEKLIAAKAEADKLDVELQKQLTELEEANAAKRKFLDKSR